jgi:L-alanine-DL-glutamate epimerase-like enolase superfamily enzyme
MSKLRIDAVETIVVEEFPNLVYVRLHTTDGIVGLGETFHGANSVAAWVHDTAAPYLLGKDPLLIERHWQQLRGFVGLNSTGVENRGRSAVDIALWDIFGKVTGQPIHQLLGGAVRDRIRLYNTCAGYRYARRPMPAGLASSATWGIPAESAGPYEDLDAFMHRADELAMSLLDMGIGGMKLWPFDPPSESTNGTYISHTDLEVGLEPFRKIRSAVGDRIEIMVDLHTNWDLPSALRIAHALDEFSPAWIEDPIRPDDLRSLRQFTQATKATTVAGETLGTRWSYRAVMEERAVDVVMFDPVWVGGISEARRVASMVESFQRSVTVHDCNGPVQFATAVHLSAAIPNAYWQEFVRAYYYGWYDELLTDLPEIRDGWVYPLPGPGLGTDLRPEVLERPDIDRRMSRA